MGDPAQKVVFSVRDADYKIGMYDPLTSTYTFSCPVQGETSVRLSAFRLLQRLPGAAHPAVFRVSFACPCGAEHPALVSHDELDWAPLGLTAGSFLNLMTSRIESMAQELGDLAASRINAGDWPWTFFCYPEDRPRPVFPSAFFLLAPGDGSIGLAFSCPACSRISVNLVSHTHVDVPFHHDPEIGVVEHVFSRDAAAMIEEFRADLDSARFDARRLALE